MSKQVDERIVSMQFDNRHFEKNVQTSIGTLEKLKSSLKLDDASKGFDKLSKSAKNVDMDCLGKSVDNVRSRFSAMEVVGVTALANITNSAVNAGKRILASLTIDPVKTGFNEYELKMDSVKTIMASTGESVENVNKYLEELNEYSDQTIYSFADMTQNIGKFTNAGVKLEDAVLAIKGISNEAAVSGANANEASRAMYNFAQALSAGYVKLIDWKSIENANMATMEFKEQLIKSAVAAGTLTEAGDGLYKTLSGHTLNATKDFNDSLKDEWMTTEVLVKTLKDYADVNTEIGAKAFEAATKVTKFSQMMDVLKETAQSGWARTWEIIFGDIEQAKALFTPLTNFFSRIIDGISDFRNNLLEAALSSPIVVFAKKVANLTHPLTEATDAVKDLGEIVDKVIRGDFGNVEKRWNKLTELGYDWKHVQNLVNEKLGNSYRYATDYAESTAELTAQIVKLTDEELRNLGFTDDEIRLFRELEKQSEETGVSISDLVKNMEQMDGRTMLIESFQNAGQGLVKIFKALKDAWVEIFPPMTSMQLYNAIAAMHDFSKKLAMGDKTADNLKRTLKGVFAIIDIIFTVVGGPIKILFKAIGQLLGVFNLDILTVTAYIGDAIVAFRDWIDSVLDFTDVFSKMQPYLMNAASTLKAWFGNIKTWFSNLSPDIFQGLYNGLMSGISGIWNVMVFIGTKILEAIKWVLGIHSPSTAFFEIGKNIIQGLFNGIKFLLSELFGLVSSIADHCMEIFKGIDWGTIFSVALAAGLLVTVKKITDIVSALAAPFQGLGDLLSGAGSFLEDFGEGMKKNLKAQALQRKSEAIKNFAIAIGILAASLYVISKISVPDLIKAGIALGVLMAALFVFTKFVSKIEFEPVKFAALASMLLGLSVSLLIMASAIKKLEFLNWWNVGPILLSLVVMIGGLAGVLIAFGQFVKGKAAQNIDKAGKTLTKMATTLLLLVFVIQMIAIMDPGDLLKGIGFILLFEVLIAVLALIAKIGGKNIDKLGGMMLKLAATMMLFVHLINVIRNVNEYDILKGVVVMSLFAGLIRALIWATNVREKDLSDVGRTILAMSAAIMLMAFTIQLIATVRSNSVVNGIAVVLVFGALIRALIIATNASEKDMAGIGRTMLAMAAAIGIMAVIALMLSFVEPGALKKGVIAVGFLSAMLRLMIKATRGANDVHKNILMMAVTIGILAAAVAALSFIDPGRLAIATGCLGALMAAFALMEAKSKHVNVAMGAVIALSAVIAILTGALWVLSTMPWESTLAAAGALVLLLTGLMGALFIMSKMDSIAAKAQEGIIALLLMVIPLAALVGILAMMQNIQNALTNALALVVLLGVMTGFLAFAGHTLGPSIPVITGFAGAITLLGAGCLMAGLGVALLAKGIETLVPALITGAGAIISFVAQLIGLIPLMMQQVAVGIIAFCEVIKNGAPAIFEAFTVVLTSLVKAFVICIPAIANGALQLVVALLDALNQHAPAVINGLFDFLINLINGVAQRMPELVKAGVNLLMAFFSAVIDAMKGIDMGVLVQGIAAVGLLAALVHVLAAAAASVPMAMVGLLGVGALIAELSLVLAAIGLLAQIPGLEWLISEGGDLLQAVGTAVGQLIGGLIGGIGKGLSANLVQIGADLSAFMENLKPFIEGAKLIEPSMLAGVNNIVAIILALTVASVLDALTSWFTGGNSIVDFGWQIAEFGKGLKKFAEETDGVDPNKVAAAAEASKVLGELANSLPKIGGVVQFFTGRNLGLDEFGRQLPEFGEGLAAFGEATKGIEPAKIVVAVTAAKALAEMYSVMPEVGGVVQWWNGSKMSLGVFGEQLPSFGEGLAAFGETTKDVVPETIVAAVEAAKELAVLHKDMPDVGGVVQWWNGSKMSLGVFGEQLPEFGKGLAKFGKSIEGIDPDEIGAAAKAAIAFGELNDHMGNVGGLVRLWSGKKMSLGDFGEQLPAFGEALSKFGSKLKGVNADSIRAAGEVAVALSEVHVNVGGDIEELVKSFNNVKTEDLEAFADKLGLIGKAAKALGDGATGINAADLEAVGTAINSMSEGLGAIVNDDVKEFIKSFSKDDSDYWMEFTTSMNTLFTNMGTAYTSFANMSNNADPEDFRALAQGLAAFMDMAGGSLKDVDTNFSNWNAWSELPKLISPFIDSMAEFVTQVETRFEAECLDEDLGILGNYAEFVKAAIPILVDIQKFSTVLNNGGWGDFFHVPSTDTETRIDDAIGAMGHFAEKMEEIAPKLDKIDVTSLDKVEAAAKKLKTLSESLNVVSSMNLSAYSTTLEKLSNATAVFYAKVGSISDSSIESALAAATKLSETIDALAPIDSAKADEFKTALKTLGTDAISEFVTAMGDPEAKATDAVSAFVTKVGNTIASEENKASIYENFKSVGSYAIDGFVAGLSSELGLGKVAAAAAAIGNTAVSSTKEAINSNSPSKKFMELGLFSVLGFAKGIADNLGTIDKSGASMGDRILKATKDNLGIQSPSVVFKEEVGRYIVQGIAEGIKSDMSAEEAAKQKAQNIIEAFQKEFDKNSTETGIANVDLELWLLDNETLTEAEKNAKRSEVLRENLERTRNNQTLAYSKWYANKENLGENAQETREAWEAYRNSLLETVKLQGEIEEYAKQVSAGDDIISEVAETALELWNLQNGDKATEAEKDAKTLEYLTTLRAQQAQTVADAEAEYNAAVDKFTANSTLAMEKKKEFDNATIALLQTDDSIDYLKNYAQRDRDYENLTEAMEINDALLDNWLKTAGRNASSAEVNARKLLAEETNLGYLEKQYAEAKRRHEDAILNNASDSDEIKKWFDECLRLDTAIGESQQKILDIREENKDRLLDAKSSMSEAADLEYQIWESTTGREATSMEKSIKRIATLSKQVSAQSAILQNAREEWQKAESQHGKASAEAQAAYTEYLRQELEVAKLQNEITDLNESMVERQKVAYSEYQDYVDKYAKYYSMNGMSRADLERDAKLVSGYDPTQTVNNLVSTANSALRNVTSSAEYSDLMTNFNTMGVSWSNAVSEGISSATDEITSAVLTMIGESVQVIGSKHEDWFTAAKYLIDGFVSGIRQGIDNVIIVCKQMANAAEKAVRTELDEHSPSRVFAEIGSYAVKGFAKGLSDTTDLSNEAASDIGKSAIDNLRNAIRQISDVVDSDIDTQPTIRPVLDLSNVKSGTARLNTMLSRTQAMSINTAMSKDNVETIQNGEQSSKDGNTYNFTQNNYSPKALSATEIYRQTKNQFSAMKGALR